jgi:hypothetical protein
LEPKKLPREVIRALQSVVGPEWVSEDRGVVEAYTIGCIDVPSALRKVIKSPTALSACIALPENTEQVQAIVKIANRYKITLLPFTNGQSLSFPMVPGTLVIHFSRMDKILEIDEENMRVTIQPMVDYGTLQAELMRRGLWNGGSGWHSAIAKPGSQFTTAGLWQTDLKYGGLSRNTLGFTVILPTGDIMRTGSAAIAGTGRYSFTERFPGPNLLSLFKDSLGTRGIITEISLKAHPWVGGSTFPEDVGRPSIENYFEEAKQKKFDIPPPPKRYKLVWFEYPDMKSLINGIRKMARSGIGIGLNVTGSYNAPMCTRTLAEAEKQVKEKFYPPYSGYMVIAGISSEKQMKYEEAVLNKILEETHGKLWSDQYKSEQLEAVAPWNLEFARNTVTGMRTVRSYYVATMLTPYAPFELMIDTQDLWRDTVEKLGATNIFTTMGIECPYGYVVDRGHQIETEVDQFPKRTVLKDIVLTIESEMFGWPWFEKRGYPGNWVVLFGEPFVSGSPELGPNTNILFRKIRKILDPNNVMASQKLVLTEDELEEESKNTRGGLASLRKWKKEFGLPTS